MPFGELLERFRVERTLVELRRDGLVTAPVTGLVLGFSKRLVLAQVADEDGRPDGYAVLRRGDLTRVDWDTPPLRRLALASGALARSDPVTREIQLADWRTAIESAALAAPLLTFRREDTGEKTTSRSSGVQLLKHLMVGEWVSNGGIEEGRFALPIETLTRLDFAGGFERGLERALGIAR
jgi:hypothetical protein